MSRSFQHLKEAREGEGKGKGRGGSSRREQCSDGSGRRRRLQPETGIPFARTFQSSDSDSPRKRKAGLNVSSEQTAMSVVEATSRSTYRMDVDEKRNECS